MLIDLVIALRRRLIEWIDAERDRRDPAPTTILDQIRRIAI